MSLNSDKKSPMIIIIVFSIIIALIILYKIFTSKCCKSIWKSDSTSRTNTYNSRGRRSNARSSANVNTFSGKYTRPLTLND